MRRFNNWLAIKITNGVGTMWVAYCFAILAFISLPAAISTHDPIVIVAWIAQTFLQLVLLPIIMVGQNIQAAHHKEVIKHIKRIHSRLGIKDDD
jgi:uncharacterized membrane protein